MADEYKPQQGDEAELFAAYNNELVRRVSWAVSTSRENVKDATAFAWAQFLRYQPDRSRDWRAWLFRTAQRAAWALDRDGREMQTLSAEPDEWGWAPEPSDGLDRYELRDELEAAVEVLAQLPPRLRRIALLRATGHRYREISEITGDSRTRVSSLVRRAHERVRDLLDEEGSSFAPRAAQLQALEASPPEWLLREIGRPPRGRGGRQGFATKLLDWRRAALAIEDYRASIGFNSDIRALGLRPRGERQAELFDDAVRAIETVSRNRTRCLELGD